MRNSPKDLEGKIFGRLTAVSIASTNPVKWKCICMCGKAVVRLRGNLTSGNTISCGCYRTEIIAKTKRLRPYEGLYHGLLRRCRVSKRRAMTYEEFVSFTVIHSCFYCGDPVRWAKHLSSGYAACNLDRKDNSLDYTAANCVVCCSPCNTMKSILQYDDFLHRVFKITGHLKGVL